MVQFLIVAVLVLLIAAVAQQLWWRRRFADLNEDFRRARELLETSQKQHYQAISRIEAEQQALFNSMSEGVLILDAGGRVQLVNRSLLNFFGLKVDVRGQTIMEAFRLQELVEVMRRLPQERNVQAAELELAGVNTRWLQLNAAAVLDREGTQRGSILVFHDLTRLKQLENTRQEFVANVSHELRTPLSLIKGFVETLLDGAKDDPELTGRFLRTIEKHTDRLTFLIEDLLTISRLESGQIVMNLHDLELRAEVAHVLEDLQARAAGKNTTLLNNLAADLHARADAATKALSASMAGSMVRASSNSPFTTMGPVFRPKRGSGSSSVSIALTAPVHARPVAPASVFPLSNTSCRRTAAKSGSKAKLARAPRFISRCPRRKSHGVFSTGGLYSPGTARSVGLAVAGMADLG
jgi:two-component system phosphate regulon sensor histidine kinase PhoR